MKPGLYIIATPIGNREDISMRAINTLQDIDIIACEDTRHSSQLLSAFGIKKKLISLHQHNEKNKAVLISNYIEDGKSIAYISDAGTPAISDPGANLVDHMYNQGLCVSLIPGPSSVIAAFSVSGFQTNQFQFYGFLPNTPGKCKKSLLDIYKSNITTVLFESPRRVVKTLKIIQEIFGDNHIIFIARELTKVFESLYKGKVGALIEIIDGNLDNQKGEFVLILSAVSKDNKEEPVALKDALKKTLEKLSLKQSVDIISSIYNKRKKEIYNLALEIKKNE